MERVVIVADLMSRDVVAVQPGTNLADAAQCMLRHHISGLPVLNESGHLVGVLTEGDLLRRPELGTSGRQANWLKAFLKPASLAAEYVHTHSRLVGDVMTMPPIFVRPETSLAKAAELMLQKGVKRLPVLQGDALVGVISRADMLNALAPKLVDENKDVCEEEILRAIEDALAKELWAPKAGLKVSVRGDVVRLEGCVFSEEERRAVRVLAENTPGVKQVVDLLELMDPRYRMANPAN